MTASAPTGLVGQHGERAEMIGLEIEPGQRPARIDAHADPGIARGGAVTSAAS